jgi:UDP-N-acetylmuramoyl-tripeptide--D-alanyl-D-alanine ligase
MSFWTTEGLRTAAGGSWVRRVETKVPAPVAGISIDTRTIRPGQAFAAVAGDNFDGHDFVHEAARRGATLAIVHRDPPTGECAWPENLSVIRVPDTRRALLRLASAYRQTLEGRVRVVAVSGSNGKSTTTRMIQAVLSSAMPGTASEKSFNNSIGVPLTILATRPSDKFLICEIGTNRPGEVADLAKIVSPHIAVVTSVGREHLAELGDLERIAREELGLLEFLRPGGFAVVNADSPHLLAMAPVLASGAQSTLYMFGRSDRADLRVSEDRQALTPKVGVWFEVRPPKASQAYFIPLLGRHNAVNAAAAIAVGRRFGMPDEAIAAALAQTKPSAMRCEYRALGDTGTGIGLINDAYNANPESMLAAIAMLADLSPPTPSGRRVAILGDMLELGPTAPALHAEVLSNAVADASIALIVVLGELMSRAAKEVGTAKVQALGAPSGETISRAAEHVRAGDLVLVKASRGQRLELVAEAITARFAGAGQSASKPTSPTANTPILPDGTIRPNP